MVRINRLFTIGLLTTLILGACQPIARTEVSSAQPVSTNEVFAKGALRHSAQGMAFDKDGMLWITDLIGDDISVVNPATGEIVHRYGREAGIYAPADLAIADDGTVYWTQWDTGVVGKIDQAGMVTHIAEVPPGVNEIVISPKGRLFVATCNMGDSVIEEVYPTGDKPRLIHGDLGLCAFRFGDWGPDGYFYGARTDLGEIARIDVDSGELSSVAAKLGYPADVKFDRAGTLTGADVTTGEVYRLDPTTGQKTVIATLEPGIGALVFDRNDHLYVSNEVNGSIVEVQANGAIRQVNPGGLIAPGGLTVVGDTVYLADFLSIRGYNRQTGTQTVMIPKIYGISTLSDPLVVAADGENLLVTSWLYSSVQVVSPKTGEILATYSDFNTPTNAIRFQGDLIVSELGSGSVVRARGTDLTQRETLMQNLKEPIGLAATDQEVWVSDSATGTVWQIIAAGQPLSTPKAIATNLAMPEGLAVGIDGSLLVVEAGTGRLSTIELETGERQTLATGLQTGLATANAPSFWIFNGVAVDGDGNIYVSGDVANVIYRIPTAQPQAQLDAATTAQIETILTQTMQTVGVPGYAMCIVKDGNVVYDKGFGVTQLGGSQPVTPQSVFSIRSTTKSFTAIALMQLVEQGKVDLDAPVTKYLPYFSMADPAYQQITVRMLASHTSGLIDDTTFQTMPPKSEEPAAIGAAIEWFVRSLADDKLTAAPPTVWQYAGANFILLGDIIGKVSGEPYDVYITQHLLEPLGMIHSTLDVETIPAGALVGEHVTTAGVVKATPLSDYGGFEAPEGGIYSTCEDMTRWMQVHLNRGKLEGTRILKTEIYDRLWHAETPTGLDEFFGPTATNYGLGWVMGTEADHFFAGHGGGGGGQNIGFQLVPSDNMGVTVLANWGTEPDAYPAWTAAADVLYRLLGIKAK
ncbi:MAG: serine hydrolase [Caldilineaceae bacterium]